MRLSVTPDPGGSQSWSRRSGTPLVARLAALLAFGVPQSPATPAEPAENLLVIVADDVGIEKVAAYGLDPERERTPNVDRLAAEGILFRTAWSSPTCSPTRAGLLTGRLGFRTGVGRHIRSRVDTWSLSLEEWTLPELLGELDPPVLSHAYGKWHLATGPKAATHPTDSGFAHFAGSLFNFGGGSGTGYTDWVKCVDGVLEETTAFATTDTVNDALQAIATLPEPWFVYVSFNAAHAPLEVPPAALHSREVQTLDPERRPRSTFRAMVEAMDHETGRLLEGLGDKRGRTHVVWLGDNGSEPLIADGPFDEERAKGSMYEGGIRVPLIISSPRAASRGVECAVPVTTIDLFATACELMGVEPDRAALGLDSTSLVPYLMDPAREPLTSPIYSEYFAPNGLGLERRKFRQAARDQRFKLIRIGGVESAEELYDLQLDPWERRDLLGEDELGESARKAYRALSACLTEFAQQN